MYNWMAIVYSRPQKTLFKHFTTTEVENVIQFQPHRNQTQPNSTTARHGMIREVVAHLRIGVRSTKNPWGVRSRWLCGWRCPESGSSRHYCGERVRVREEQQQKRGRLCIYIQLTRGEDRNETQQKNWNRGNFIYLFVVISPAYVHDIYGARERQNSTTDRGNPQGAVHQKTSINFPLSNSTVAFITFSSGRTRMIYQTVRL